MKKHSFLYWAPRILAILFAAFISIFALDVFDAGYSAWGTVVALFMHLIPTYLIIGALLIAWKWEHIGGAAFILLGIVYIITVWERFPAVTMLIIAGPVMLIGALFLTHYALSKRT